MYTFGGCFLFVFAEILKKNLIGILFFGAIEKDATPTPYVYAVCWRKLHSSTAVSLFAQALIWPWKVPPQLLLYAMYEQGRHVRKRKTTHMLDR